jgi:hypothetical protein
MLLREFERYGIIFMTVFTTLDFPVDLYQIFNNILISQLQFHHRYAFYTCSSFRPILFKKLKLFHYTPRTRLHGEV